MSFELLRGQHTLKTMLAQRVIDKSLSHAILFNGPAGIGKKSWGRALAQAVLCETPDLNGACMNCSSCLRFATGNNPDYYYLSPEGKHIKIEQLRLIRSRFYLKSRKKVCLIDSADKMTPETSSSLLKMMEDPPDGLYFILLTENVSLLLATIISRCQSYSIEPLNQDDLGSILDQSSVSPERKGVIYSLCGGNPGYALSLAMDAGIEEKINEVEDILSGLAANKNSAYYALGISEKLAEREDLFFLLKLLGIYFREQLLACHSNESLEIIHKTFSSKVKLPLSSTCTEELIQTIGKAIFAIERTNINKRLSLEKILIMIQRKVRICQM